MADTQTATIRLTEPAVGGDSGTWATLVNSNYVYIDEAINQSVTVSIPDTNVTLTADGSSSDQARYLRYNFTGALTADRTITLPANTKVGWASNNTTGGKNVILSAGGTTLKIPGTGWTQFYCDGTNVTLIERGGTATNDSAPAGSVGEYTSASAGPIALTTTVAKTVVTFPLASGDWEVSGQMQFVPASSTTVAYLQAGISSTTDSLPGVSSGAVSLLQAPFYTGATQILPIMPWRFSLPTGADVYLVAACGFTGTLNATGFIRARRVR